MTLDFRPAVFKKGLNTVEESQPDPSILYTKKPLATADDAKKAKIVEEILSKPETKDAYEGRRA